MLHSTYTPHSDIKPSPPPSKYKCILDRTLIFESNYNCIMAKLFLTIVKPGQLYLIPKLILTIVKPVQLYIIPK